MPVYEYRCGAGHEFERILAVKNYLLPQVCHCGRESTKVILHPPKVFSDYEGYESPGTGKWVEGRRARERDLAECNCVPYDPGMREDAQRRQVAEERQLDKVVDAVVEQTMHDLTA